MSGPSGFRREQPGDRILDDDIANSNRSIPAGIAMRVVGLAVTCGSGYVARRLNFDSLETLSVMLPGLTVGVRTGIKLSLEHYAARERRDARLLDPWETLPEAWYGKWPSRIRTFGGTLLAHSGTLLIGFNNASLQEAHSTGAKVGAGAAAFGGWVMMLVGEGATEAAVRSAGQSLPDQDKVMHAIAFGVSGERLKPLNPEE